MRLSDYLESNVFNDFVPIESKDDELMELKYFFYDNMLDYDFDEFLAFYNSCNEDLSIEEIKDLFVEDKLNNSLGTKEEFITYFTYLIHHFYYNELIGKYDDAFINLVQIVILTSNKAKNKNKILESNPHSIDVFLAIEELESLNYSFDVPRLFYDAVNTFKIKKYNKNHDKVLNDLKEIFD